jgi:hypothetical protein
MGFPAEAISGIYRNNLKDVQRFMNTRHPGAYKLYGLSPLLPKKLTIAANAIHFLLFKYFDDDVDTIYVLKLSMSQLNLKVEYHASHSMIITLHDLYKLSLSVRYFYSTLTLIF